MPKIMYYSIIILIIIRSLSASDALSFKKEEGIIAYDCTNSDINITSFSLNHVTPCSYETANITTTEVNVQVIQAKKFLETHVYQCKVILKRRIVHCGMHSHTSEYEGGFKYSVKEFSSEECIRLHETGSLRLHNEIMISELTRNNSNHGEVEIVGKVTGNNCKGGHFHDGIRQYNDAVVFLEYDISIYDYTAKHELSTGNVIFKNNLVCPFSKGHCLDSTEGYLTWNVYNTNDCSKQKYAVIYDGIANKTMNMNKHSENPLVLYSAVSHDQLFSMKVTSKRIICGHPGFATDHQDIYIIELEKNYRVIENNPLISQEFDLFTYFNSKITIVEHHLSNQLASMYTSIMNELCKLEKSLLETRLISARINPQDFASNLAKSSGYTAVIAGEVIYIIKCSPTYVTLALTDKCYQEIPVIANNQRMFLSAVTHILQRRGTEIECTPIMPAKYQFGSKWFSLDGRLREVPSPQELSTNIEMDWKYDSLPNLMKIGVYDPDSVKKMRDFIYDNDDKRSATAIIQRTLAGSDVNRQGYDFSHIISENVFETTIQKYWTKFISFSSILGQVTSSIVGLWLIGKALKFIVDSVIHGKILYEIYGLSWKLTAAFWDSLTTFLSHKYHSSPHHKDQYSPDKRQQEEFDTKSSSHTTSCPTDETIPMYPTLPYTTSQIYRSIPGKDTPHPQQKLDI